MKAARTRLTRRGLAQPALIMGTILVAYLVAYVAAWATVNGGARVPVVDLLNVAGPLLASVFCAFAARRASDRSLARFWIVLAAAMFLAALAQATWAFYEVVQGKTSPFPSVADVFGLISYPLQFAAIISLRSLGSKGRTFTVGVVLEAAVFALATALLVWQFVMLPSVDLKASALTNVVWVLYPGGDILLLAALAALALLPKRGAMPEGMLSIAAAFFFYVVAGLARSVAQSTGTYSSGSWMDPLWPFAYTLIGAAAAWQFTRVSTRTAGRRAADENRGDSDLTPAATPAAPSGVQTRRDQLRTAVPYVAAPVAIFFILYTQTDDKKPACMHSTAPMIAAVLLLALVLVRQAVTLIERNHLQSSLLALHHDLENRVKQRTKELSLLNQVAHTMSHCGSSRQVVENGLRLAQEALGCEAIGLSLRGHGARRRFFGGVGLKKQSRAKLSEAARHVLDAPGPDETDQVMDTPVVVDGVAVVPLVSRQASLGGLCLAPWEEANYHPNGNGSGKCHKQVAFAQSQVTHDSPQLELASALAAQIAVAFENARRFEDAHYLAERDPVTGLLDHRGMNSRLEQELARCARMGSKFSVVMMDMDNFKLFNDTYGHAVGDEVLGTVAKTLSKAVRKYDVVARYGGDEFVALLPDCNTDGATVLVKRLRQSIKDNCSYVEKATLNRVPIELSYGIATYPNQGDRVTEVMSAADSNLSKSKSKGGDWITAPSLSVGHRTNAKLGVFNVLDGLVTTVDNKDHYTRQHSDDVCVHAIALAIKMGLSVDNQRVLRTAAILHDVGKIGVPDSILRKPGALTDEEFEIIKQHVVLSKLIIKEVPDLDEVLAAVATHHERYDGFGYPDGIKGEHIPLLGRVLGLTDAYSAMTTDRPYRRAMTVEEAVAELKRVAGKQLDPELVPVFCEVVEERLGQLVTANLTIE